MTPAARDFTIRHFGNRSVPKLEALGISIDGLEPTQAGLLYRVERGGKTDLMLMQDVGEEFLGWAR